MKVLILGGGGREHALAWKAAASPRVERVYVAPGNAGTAREPRVENVAIAADDLERLAGFAHDQQVGLTIVGPEAPLVAGLVDHFQDAGLACFGPRRAAATLEGSKAFTKDFLTRHGIPTASYAVFEALEPALTHLRGLAFPQVIKADGLAAGKGVVIAQSLTAAEATVRDMLAGQVFGAAGRRVVIEELLRGEEASFIVMVDGRHVLPLASSQDHKARDDGDRGPNTGGMGAYSPAPVVTPDVHRQIMDQVILPTVRGMAAEGNPYVGFLYAGLMIGEDGVPRVLEYNCRFGDPEAEPLLLRLRSDLVQLCLAALAGRLDQEQAQWDPRPALGVVMVAGGYPEAYRKGDTIEGLERLDGPELKIFHAGTAEQDGRVLTSGGRVLCVTALGATVTAAQARAYRAVEQIRWPGAYFRRDIGQRAVAREERER
jgi:phosphoribosylamine--glycine ligase